MCFENPNTHVREKKNDKVLNFIEKKNAENLVGPTYKDGNEVGRSRITSCPFFRIRENSCETRVGQGRGIFPSLMRSL